LIVKENLVIAGFVLLIAFGVWMQFFAPCAWFQYDRVKDVPARCFGVK
jgi:hypothetical protein